MPRTPGVRSATIQVKIAAVRLVRSGMSQTAVADAFGVHPSTVSRWWHLGRTGGSNALSRRPVSGRPRKLPVRELRKLAAMVRQPPSTYGLASRHWTLALVAGLIDRSFGVQYHPSHVWRILRELRVRYD